jgi:hypothetical protein
MTTTPTTDAFNKRLWKFQDTHGVPPQFALISRGFALKWLSEIRRWEANLRKARRPGIPPSELTPAFTGNERSFPYTISPSKGTWFRLFKKAPRVISAATKLNHEA